MFGHLLPPSSANCCEVCNFNFATHDNKPLCCSTNAIHRPFPMTGSEEILYDWSFHESHTAEQKALLELTCSTNRENDDFVEVFHLTAKPLWYLLDKYIDGILVVLKVIGHENHRMDAAFLLGTNFKKSDLVDIDPIHQLTN